MPLDPETATLPARVRRADRLPLRTMPPAKARHQAPGIARACTARGPIGPIADPIGAVHHRFTTIDSSFENVS
jgi:hypothetical protein